mmetsp:Transcript_48331/g.35518  ORF Transcript_48331/g.35518 Transcript_48331/m.35518 type:complete len:95 (+) Transcript_48331:379-663(+)
MGYGFGKACLHNAALSSVWSHLPGRKGFATGFVVCGVGIGAFSYGLLARHLVNPDNMRPYSVEVAPGIYEKYFPEAVNSRVPYMLHVLCACWSL